eukprot:7469058-Pyramimonas_sp.AAC.1
MLTPRGLPAGGEKGEGRGGGAGKGGLYLRMKVGRLRKSVPCNKIFQGKCSRARLQRQRRRPMG